MMMTLKSRSLRPRFQVLAEQPRPIRPAGSGILAIPADTDAPADSIILRRWIAHQAATYNSLLETIAAASTPASHGDRDR